MKFTSKLKSAILDFFKANLITKEASSASGPPSQLAGLKRAMEDGDAEELWRLWGNLIAERAESLYLNEYLVMTVWGVPIIPHGKRKSFAPADVDEAQLRDWLKTELAMSFDFSSVSPLNWIESLVHMTNLYRTFEKRMNSEGWRILLTSIPTFGEIPLVLGLLYPELSCCKGFVTLGKKSLVFGVENAVDSQGFPGAQRLASLRPWLACCVRTSILMNRAGRSLFPAAARRHIEWLMLQTLRWTRSDGSQVFSPQFRDGLPAEELQLYLDMMETAVKLDDDPNDAAAARELLSSVSGRNNLSVNIEVEDEPVLPEPSYFSDDAMFAAICADWSTRSCMLHLDAAAQSTCQESSETNVLDMNMELSLAGSVICSGLWTTKIIIDGQELVPCGHWVASVEEKDTRYTCLEWSRELSGGWKLERLAAVFPEERLMYLADALIFEGKKKSSEFDIVYQSRLPLDRRARINLKHGAREFKLGCRADPKSTGCATLAQLFPLALDEWRHGAEDDGLIQEKNAIVLRCRARGKGFYSPMLFDLDTKRCEGPVTWRHLEVGCEGKRVPDDEAVGYRIRLGNEQYLVYRSLRENQTRSVLGHHLLADFLFARFNPSSGVESLIELEDSE